MTSNEWWRTLPTPVQLAAAVPGHKTLLSKYFPGWHNAQECPRVFIPQGPDLAFNFFCQHVPHVCFTYIDLSEIVLFCWVRSCDSCLSVSDSATKLRVYLLFWGMTSSTGMARLPVGCCDLWCHHHEMCSNKSTWDGDLCSWEALLVWWLTWW